MTDKTQDIPPLEIHVGKTGSVRVDPAVLFAQPEVQEEIKRMQAMFEQLKLENEHLSSGNRQK